MEDIQKLIEELMSKDVDIWEAYQKLPDYRKELISLELISLVMTKKLVEEYGLSYHERNLLINILNKISKVNGKSIIEMIP